MYNILGRRQLLLHISPNKDVHMKWLQEGTNKISQKEVINIPIRSLLESIAHGLIFSYCTIWTSNLWTSKTSQLAIRHHHSDALRKETSTTRTNQEIHAMMQPTKGWMQEMHA